MPDVQVSAFKHGDRVRISPGANGTMPRCSTGTVKWVPSHLAFVSVLVDGNKGASYFKPTRLTVIDEVKTPLIRVTEGVRDMLAILEDPEATEDEKSMAASTIVEAVAPDIMEAAVRSYRKRRLTATLPVPEAVEVQATVEKAK
jgi:hypothetical protein